MAPSRRSSPSNNEENPDIAAIIAQQLQNILPQIVTQVTDNVNNANGGNGGNGGNNGCTYKGFMTCNPKEYDGKRGAIALTRWIEKMENIIDNSECVENQKVKYAASSFVNKDLTWWNTQVQERGRWNEYLRKGRKTKPKRQNRTRNGKARKRQSQSPSLKKSTESQPKSTPKPKVKEI
ncbi:hypothetical protein Tco_0946307 [Tanacetum coccineum]